MGGEQDRAAGRFVHAARLHADIAVLDQIEPADAVVVAELVERGEQRRGREALAVDRDRISLLERDLDDGRLVGRRFRIDGARIDIARRLQRGVFEHFALGGDVQEIGVGGERRFAETDHILIAKDKRGEAPFSTDANLLHVSSEGKVLEDPALETPGLCLFAHSSIPELGPDKPTVRRGSRSRREIRVR